MSQSDISKSEQSQIMDVAHQLADAARRITLRHFRSNGLTADNKLETGFDPVTIADREVELAMRAILTSQRPQDGILGEEFGSVTGTSGLVWVLDPIDGTRGFISGTPTWGVLIAVSDANGPIYGLIDQPYIQERFAGGFGRAHTTSPHGDAPLACATRESLSEAILFTTFPEVGTPQDRSGFEAVAAHVKLVRYGMDCYAYALVAAGQVDLVVEASLNPYDIQAPIGLIHAAGGIVTNWRGGPAHDGGQAIAASNNVLHRAALELLAPYAD